MNRVTCLNRTLKEQGFPAYHALVLAAIRRKGGCLERIAFDLGVSRRHVYRAIMFAGLWSEVVAARARPVHNQSDPLARALSEL